MVEDIALYKIECSDGGSAYVGGRIGNCGGIGGKVGCLAGWDSRPKWRRLEAGEVMSSCACNGVAGSLSSSWLLRIQVQVL